MLTLTRWVWLLTKVALLAWLLTRGLHPPTLVYSNF